jgi:hypothetical protein
VLSPVIKTPHQTGILNSMFRAKAVPITAKSKQLPCQTLPCKLKKEVKVLWHVSLTDISMSWNAFQYLQECHMQQQQVLQESIGQNLWPWDIQPCNAQQDASLSNKGISQKSVVPNCSYTKN